MVKPRARLQDFWTKILAPTSLPFKVVVYSDFDGTISEIDSLKYILNHRGDKQWRTIEKAMASGEMAERQGLPKCFEHYHQTFDRTLKDVLTAVKVDPYFSRFHSWCARQGHELTVLSGGFESLIRPLFAKAGISNVKVLANDVQVKGNSWNIKACGVKPLCDLCNHCKSASLLETIKKDPRTCIVYIGDGHTDSCPVQLADIVFAKGHLAKYCGELGIDFYEFSDFRDVLRQLRWKLRLLARYLENRTTLFSSLTRIDSTAKRFIERAQCV